MTDASPLLAGIELGGTKSIAVLGRPGTVLERRRVETATPSDTLTALADTIAQWHAREPVAAIGVAAFGPIRVDAAHPEFGRIGATPKPGWQGTDVLAPFRALGLPLGLDTDVNGAALAEGLWGGATGLSDFAYITVGTGVGAGLVAGGRPIHGVWHPEAGHVRLARAPGDGFAGVCPYHGDCVEGLVSGPAIAARTGRPAETLPPDHPVWALVAAELGGLVAMLRLVTSPARVLLGGGLPVGQPHLLPLIRQAEREEVAGYLGREEGEIVHLAALGADAGPLGALAIALAALEEGGTSSARSSHRSAPD